MRSGSGSAGAQCGQSGFPRPPSQQVHPLPLRYLEDAIASRLVHLSGPCVDHPQSGRRSQGWSLQFSPGACPPASQRTALKAARGSAQEVRWCPLPSGGGREQRTQVWAMGRNRELLHAFLSLSLPPPLCFLLPYCFLNNFLFSTQRKVCHSTEVNACSVRAIKRQAGPRPPQSLPRSAQKPVEKGFCPLTDAPPVSLTQRAARGTSDRHPTDSQH